MLGVSTVRSRILRSRIAVSARPYVLAVIMTLAAEGSRLALGPLLGRRLPFATFYLSAMLSAWLGRWRAGAVATLLGGVGGYLLAPPHLTFSNILLGSSELNGMVLFLLIGAMSTALIEAHHRAVEALGVSSERLHQALDAARMLAWTWRGENLTVESGNLAQILGLPAATPQIRRGDFLRHIHAGDRAEHEAACARAAIRGGTYVSEFRFIRPDTGATIWLQDKGHVFLSNAGQVELVRGVMTDITRHKELEQELQENSRRKDEFLAMLGHELRNPLAPIRNAAELLRLLSPEQPQLTQARVIIERQVAHLSRLVDDLLDVARITKGKITLRQEQVDLGDVIRRAVDTVRPTLEQRRHDLHLSLPHEPLPLLGDFARLVQVFGNLLSNAVTFTPSGGRISVFVEAAGGRVLVRVQDTGMGIEPTVLPSIFDLFVQQPATPDRQHGGLGIGLSVVKRLVELHGGSVEARSPGPGAGSEFRVILPLAHAPARPTAAPAAVPEQDRGAVAPLPVLVVEDNADAADSLAMLLQLQGHTACIARDGAEALRSAQEFTADVAFIDIGLPGIDGYEVARRLRGMDSFQGAFLVAMSGYGQAEDKQRAREAGFDQHLTKPVALEAIETVIELVAARKNAVERCG
jgi:PAS domain S-box-containing protein